MKKLYFVESIKHSDNTTTALLLYIPENISGWEKENRDFKWFTRTDIAGQTEIMKEGAYVYLIGQNEYISASEDDRVLRINERSSRLLGILSQRVQNEHIFSYQNINTLYSYHINVGHGNHSLIVFNPDKKFHIWMVDCSDYDFVSHRYYRNNIDKCLNHIKRKFELNSVHIEIVMLTHPHYDHYSGINYYIDNKYIDNSSTFYINLQYGIKSHNFNNLLSGIYATGSHIIQPFTDNGGGNIQILYPDKYLFRKNNLSLNDKSSVYNICFDNVSYFVFPGDIETTGWDLLDIAACYPYMKRTRYYAISHHGSINGHIRNDRCGRGVTCIKDCLSPTTVPVLMGRDNAFSGIYSAKVLHDFAGRILYSEKSVTHNPTCYLEIDLLTSKYAWYL